MVEETQTIFHKIVKGEIKAEVVYENDDVLAFKDVNPVSSFHVLVIPKKMSGLTSLAEANSDHTEILGKLMLAVSTIAKENKLEKGFRTVINTGEEAGQSVFYIHIHIIAGRMLTWPPG